MKSCLVILAGKCFGAQNEVVPNLKQQNPNWQIDVWVLGWDVDYDAYPNDVEDIKTRFQAEVCELDNYAEIGARVPTYRLMTRWLTRGAGLIRSRQATTYDAYICGRPELTRMRVHLDALRLTDSCVYLYACPSYALTQCSGICDWVTIGSLTAIQRFADIRFEHDPSLSNESNLRRAYEANGLECRLLGVVYEDVVKRDCDPRK
jgi:hypothetical protein